jgi:hypothetical protein
MGRVWWRPALCAPARARLLPALALALITAACGASATAAHRRPPGAAAAHLATPCAHRAGAALARATSLPAASIVASTFTAPGGEASCRFTTRGAGGARTLDVVAELDSAPQAFYRLEREVVEYGQNVLWHNEGAAAYPRDVAHLGLDADWLAAADQLITTDGVRLITILVNAAPAHAADGAEGIAASLARCYLGPLVPPRA